jgi:hypothetical protein
LARPWRSAIRDSHYRRFGVHRNAPEGHAFTVATISSTDAAFGSIHGLRSASNTVGRLRTQLAACVHTASSYVMVM